MTPSSTAWALADAGRDTYSAHASAIFNLAFIRVSGINGDERGNKSTRADGWQYSKPTIASNIFRLLLVVFAARYTPGHFAQARLSAGGSK
jgi:hypothetical protein